MSQTSDAMDRRQKARSSRTGKYSVMTKGEGATLSHTSGEDPELTNAQWLAAVSSTDADPRTVPSDPLRRGVTARVTVTEETAEDLIRMYNHVASQCEEDYNYREIPFAEDYLNGCSFELVEEVKTGYLGSPTLWALDLSGGRTMVADFEELPSGMPWSPDFAEGDGNMNDVSSLRHVSTHWPEAVAESQRIEQEKIQRAHDLIEDLGWDIQLYSSRNNQWIAKNDAPERASISFGEGEIISTSTWKPAAFKDYATILGESEVHEDNVDMIKQTLKIVAKHPSPAMKHQIAREPVVEKLRRIHGVPYEELNNATKMLAIVKGEALPPARGPLAKQAKELATMRDQAAAAEVRYNAKKALRVELAAGIDQLGDVPEVIELVLQKELAGAISYEQGLGGEAFKARQSIDRLTARWESSIERDATSRAERAAVNAELTAMDDAFAVSQLPQ